MKKIFLTLAAALVLVACSGTTGLKGELVGDYNAEIALPDTSEDDVAAQMAAAMLSQIKMEMNFQANGTVDIVRSMGENSNTAQADWEVKADSLFIIEDSKTQSFQVCKTDDGFKLNGEEMSFVLTKK